MRDRLLLRGYSNTSLKKAFRRATTRSRQDLLYSQQHTKSDNSLRIITKYCNQHTEIRKIVSKYWHILMMDPNLRRLLPEAPHFTFRRATSIASELVRSEYRGEREVVHCKYRGTYMCGACGYCRYMDTSRSPILPNDQILEPRHFANCQTFGVIYLLKCECGCFYIGKTKLPFWKRAYRHIHSMQVCNPDLPLGRHTTLVHSGVFPKIKFLILDRNHPNLRGGDWNKSLLQLELRWIYNLKATRPPGLNDAVCFRPFLEGFNSGGIEK